MSDYLSIGAIDRVGVESGQAGLPGENLRDQQRTIEQQLTRIEARLGSLDEEQAEGNVAQAKAELQRLHAEVEAARTALTERQSAWEIQKAAWESEKAEAEQMLNDRVAGLDALRVDLESQRVALERKRRQWESQCRNAVADQAAASETETKPAAEAETLKTAVQPTNAAPVDLAAILRRTGFQIDQAGEEEPSEEHIDLKNEPSDGAAAEEPSIDISAPIARKREPAESGEEEVSIDEYMANLLARSRGGSPPSLRPTASTSRAPVVAPPRQSPAPIVPLPRSEPLLSGEPVEIAPRAVAPERQIDLRAMRQLANVSAKNALHKHESKRLSATTRTKLLVTCVSVVVGVSLLVIHQMPGASPVTIYGAVAAFAVAALWGVNYLKLVSRMASERLAYMSRHLKVGEEPAATVKEEKP